MHNKTKVYATPTMGKGVPQGSSFGPLLAMLVKSVYIDQPAIYREPLKHIQYVDDGITDVPVKGEPNYAGCHIEPSKSGYVKKDGQWLKPLKFLGLSYDGVTDTLKSQTRKGANLVLSDDIRYMLMYKLNMKV